MSFSNHLLTGVFSPLNPHCPQMRQTSSTQVHQNVTLSRILSICIMIMSIISSLVLYSLLLPPVPHPFVQKDEFRISHQSCFNEIASHQFTSPSLNNFATPYSANIRSINSNIAFLDTASSFVSSFNSFWQFPSVEATDVTSGSESSSWKRRFTESTTPQGASSPHSSSNHTSRLTIHLIPHSHCDPGWIKTFSQYYNSEVHAILSNTLEELLKNPDRRFQWNEISFFKRWYENLDDATKNQFRHLLSTRQWEFVGAGWTQNDEALLTHSQIVQQLTQGHQYLKETFGELLPPIRSSWQIDPFGHSKIFAKLVKLMRFDYHVLDRVDERLKYQFRVINGSGVFERDQSFQFNWNVLEEDKTSPSQHGRDTSNHITPATSIFTHVLDHMYIAPEYCYKNQTNNETVCTGFDFEDGGDFNPPITEENAAERSSLFYDYIMSEVAPFYRTSHLLIPMGHDFSYQNAKVWFDNMDALMKEINSHQHDETYGGANLRYSTISEYFDAVIKEAGATHSSEHASVETQSQTRHMMNSDSTSDNSDSLHPLEAVQFPMRKFDEPDFFPFTNCWGLELQAFNNCVAYWSGFFTSRPEFKRKARQHAALLRSAEVLYVYALSRKNFMPVPVDWELIFTDLNTYREAVALTTHHDAITGTSTPEVMKDYVKQLNEAAKAVEAHMQRLLALLIATDVTQIPSLNIAYRKPLEYSTKSSIDGIMPIVIFNSLAWQRVDYISVTVPPGHYSFNVSTIDENTKEVINLPAEQVNNELMFLAQAPPLGFNTYFVSAKKLDPVDDSSVVRVEKPIRRGAVKSDAMQHLSTPLRAPSRYITLYNGFMEVTFQLHDGKSLPYVMKSIRLVDSEKTYSVTQTLMSYESYADGAYIFRPRGDAEPIRIDPTEVKITSMKLHGSVQEIEQQLTPHIKQRFRLYDSTRKNTADMTYFVEMQIISTCGETQELISRFETDIESHDSFYTDSNGFQMVERKRAPRFHEKWQPLLLSGNFYPMTTQSLIRDEDTQFALFSNHAAGVASQSSGSLEVMFNRRTQTDDHRGLNEPLNVTTPSTSVFRFSIMSIDASESLRSQQSLFFEHPLVTFSHSNLIDLVPRPTFHIQDYFKILETYGVSVNALPENIHLLSLQSTHPENGTTLMRLHHIFEPHQDLVHSKPSTIFLQSIFDKYEFIDLFETSLTALHDLSGNLLQIPKDKLNDPIMKPSNIVRGPMSLAKEPVVTDSEGGDSDQTKITLDPLQIRTFRITFSAKDVPQSWNWLSFLIGGTVTALLLLLGATCLFAVYRYSVLQEKKTLVSVESINHIDREEYDTLNDSSEEDALFP